MNIPKPKKLPSGNWRIQVQIDGRRYSITDPDQKVVKQKAKELYAGIEFEARKILSVGDAYDKYIESKDSVLSPSTIVGYKRLRKNVFQGLMPKNITELTQEDIQKEVNKEYKRGLSPKSIRNAHGLLSAVLKVYRPKMMLTTTLPQKARYEARIPSEEEMSTIISSAKGTKYELPILLACWLGLRMSEILGLEFSDIIDGRIHIQRAIVEGENGPSLKGTKTFSGDRWIKCPKYILDLIDAKPNKNGHVIKETGAMIYKAFVNICKESGIAPCRFHDLRHFAASEAHMLGVPDKYQMKRMGHKTDNMLKTVYQHTIKDKEDCFSDLIDAHMTEVLLFSPKSAHETAHENQEAV